MSNSQQMSGTPKPALTRLTASTIWLSLNFDHLNTSCKIFSIGKIPLLTPLLLKDDYRYRDFVKYENYSAINLSSSIELEQYFKISNRCVIIIRVLSLLNLQMFPITSISVSTSNAFVASSNIISSDFS